VVKGRRAGGTKRGGDFLRHDSALPHAGDDHAAIRLAAAQDQIDGAVEIRRHRAFKSASERLQSRRFRAHQRRRLQAVRIRRSFAIGGIHWFLMVTAQGNNRHFSRDDNQYFVKTQAVSPRHRFVVNTRFLGDCPKLLISFNLFF